MPKQKTRKSIATRFKLTKGGKLLHRAQSNRHLKRKKSKSQIRRGKQMHETVGTRKNKILKMF